MVYFNIQNHTTYGVLMVLVTLALVTNIEGQDRPSKKDKCSLVLCKPVMCKNAYVPAGQCCKVCPKDIFRCDKSFEKPWSKEYKSPRIPANRTLVGDCTYDVGTCPTGTCRYNIYRHKGCPDDGIICPVGEYRKVDCGVFGTKEVKYITHCACCKDSGITVVGTVTDYDTSETLSAMSVSINTNGIVLTDEKGFFKETIPATTQVVIHVTDPSGVYIVAVKVIDLPATYRGTLNVEIRMIKAAPPVSIDPTKDNMLSISGDPTNLGQGVAQLIINANSITDMAGNPYSQSVQISITAPSVNDSFTDELGQFITVNGEALMSDGILQIDLRTDSGDPLTGQVVFRVRQGMALWLLDEAKGRWALAPTTNVNRRKRQIDLTDDLLTQINTGNWYNIDKIPGVPRCYFKARVFYENPADAANPATFAPGVVAYTPNNERLRLYFPYTSDLDSKCFEVRCLDFNPANQTNVLIGLMNLTSAETVSIGGSFIPVITQLKPKNLADYSSVIEVAHTAVRYNVLPNQKDVFVNFISNSNGGFYQDLSTCMNSTIDQPAFHFIKPSLPAYEPIPDGTNLCTARINFTDAFNFSATIDDLPSMPGFTATSVWSSAGTNYHYTYSTSIQKDNDGVRDFYYACIQYRCSEGLENTTVYLNIDIPTVPYFNNFTNNVTEQAAFSCWGPCSGTLCGQSLYQTSIEGAFIAPELVPGQNGPDFYDGTNIADCASRNSNEAFAFSFYCYRKQRF
ncbi:uncharacterized protein LOC127880207 [Dreissena polymorpha]|uniref:uncharacterized protein LOC127880207 n=1 Tax=Dreissena polymorpha TaxID=45954 RepID=UPI0022644A35|nr:uncharacterized protein LOC127880207 [Dreissena polymorpha]